MFELLHLILFLKSTSNSKYFNCPRGAIKETVHSITSQMICEETVAVKSANLPLTCVTEAAVMGRNVTKDIFLFYRSSGGCETVTCLFFGGFFFWH